MTSVKSGVKNYRHAEFQPAGRQGISASPYQERDPETSSG